MYPTNYILLLAACLCIAGSCKKEEDDNRHRDIFRCEINGVLWEAGCLESPPFGCNIVDCQYYEESGGFEIAGTNKEKTRGISFRKSSTDGGILIGNNFFTKMTYGQEGVSYNLMENDTGFVSISLIDLEKKIIEGHFYFRALSNTGVSVNITNGYFKVRYRP